ncbi:MAG: hypothetical protein ACPGWR_31945 [Ardenticatenaceae bacterium]
MRVLPPPAMKRSFTALRRDACSTSARHEEILHCAQEGCVFYLRMQGGKASCG